MQKTDIVPDLKKRIDKTFKDLIENDEVLSDIREKISKSGTWEDAQEYAGIIGSHRSTSFLENISSEDLPNGQMYYNIANRIIPPALESDYEQVSEVCMEVQEQANEAARIGIKAQKADLNQDRIDGIVNRISSEPFDDVKWLLDAPIENFMRSVVDDHVEKNADFHYKSGLNPVIKRTTDGKCCKWCSQHAGTFPYKPGMDREVFRRHENCGCLVAYYPDAKSKQYQNARTREWHTEDEEAKNQELAENNKKKKQITDEAINSVPCAKLEGWTDEKAQRIQAIHQEVLRMSKNENDSNEVGVCCSSDGKLGKFVKGESDRLDFGQGYIGGMAEVFHNHPGCSSFSANDLQFFAGNSGVKLLTIVKNNGSVEMIGKTDQFDLERFSREYMRNLKKSAKGKDLANLPDSTYDKIISKTLTKMKKDGLIVWKEFIHN